MPASSRRQRLPPTRSRSLRWPTFRRDSTRRSGTALGRNGIVPGAQIARIDKKIPPSWKLADLIITAGLRGILFPSLRHAGGTNLVIFPANLVDGDHVAAHDPDDRLPHDQSSWS
nr:RES family NAD+ phosphorylase [Mesorhizobium sp.]